MCLLVWGPSNGVVCVNEVMAVRVCACVYICQSIEHIATTIDDCVVIYATSVPQPDTHAMRANGHHKRMLAHSINTTFIYRTIGDV